MKLTRKAVEELMCECLSAVDDGGMLIMGLVVAYRFNPEAIKRNEAKIQQLLAELPEVFRTDEGGGYSFLQMPLDRHGNQWGSQPYAENLLALGIAVERAAFLFPRSVWNALPGSVPYITVEVRDGKHI